MAPRRGGRSPPGRLEPSLAISTEHFEIQTNVPLAEAISFGRRLEAFHDLFMTLLADILGENLPLDPALQGPDTDRRRPACTKLHQVYYFASKAEFVDHLSPTHGARDRATAWASTTRPSRARGRVPAYFFRDPERPDPRDGHALPRGLAPVALRDGRAQCLHQERRAISGSSRGWAPTSRPSRRSRTARSRSAAWSAPRIEEAYQVARRPGPVDPAGRVRRARRKRLHAETRIYPNYQQAMALTVFLMQWHQGTTATHFSTTSDAYRGRIKRATGRSLQDRLGQTYSTLDSQFLAFLKDGQMRTARNAACAENRTQPGHFERCLAAKKRS